MFWSYPRRCYDALGERRVGKKSRHAISPRRGANGVYVNEFLHHTMLSELGLRDTSPKLAKTFFWARPTTRNGRGIYMFPIRPWQELNSLGLPTSCKYHVIQREPFFPNKSCSTWFLRWYFLALKTDIVPTLVTWANPTEASHTRTVSFVWNLRSCMFCLRFTVSPRQKEERVRMISVAVTFQPCDIASCKDTDNVTYTDAHQVPQARRFIQTRSLETNSTVRCTSYVRKRFHAGTASFTGSDCTGTHW